MYPGQAGGYPCERNAEVDFWRIIFAFAIVLCHSHGLNPADPSKYPFVGGYLSVEFFFILSGYFSVKKAAAAPDASYRDAARWTVRRYLGVLPYVIPAVILYYLLTTIWIEKLPLAGICKALVSGIMEMLLLPASGMYDTFYVLPLWYLSAMLLMLPLFYALLIKNKEAFLWVACPLSACLIYGYFCRTQGHMDTWRQWTGLFFTSLPRAWAGMCLGGVVFLLSEGLRKTAFRPCGQHVLSLTETVCGAFVLWYMYTRGYRKLDFVALGVEAVWAGIILSGAASIHRMFPSWLSRFSGFTLALYVSHWTVRALVPAQMQGASYEEMLLPYVLLSTLLGVVLEMSVTLFRKLHLGTRMRKYLIE